MTLTMRIADPFSGLREFVLENEPLAPYTWYKIGGPARWFIMPRNPDELREAVLRCRENDVSVRVLGLGANLLVSDEGVDAAVFRFSEDHWNQTTFRGERVEVGAGVDMQKLILRTVRAGLAGIETLAGIPGTIGGGVRMNAGGKFGDLGAVVRRVTVMDSEGTIFHREKDDLLFSYRSSNIVAPFILGATLELDEEDPDQLVRRMKEVWMYKRNSQPLNTKNAGCIFKNPPGGSSAGALIDQAGLKGTRVGGAEVSAKHANFIVAHPDCKAADVRRLIKLVQEKVAERHGVELHTEVMVWD